MCEGLAWTGWCTLVAFGLAVVVSWHCRVVLIVVSCSISYALQLGLPVLDGVVYVYPIIVFWLEVLSLLYRVVRICAMSFEDRNNVIDGIIVDEVQVGCLVSLVECDADVARGALCRSGGCVALAVDFIFQDISSRAGAFDSPIRSDGDEWCVPLDSDSGSDGGIPCAQRSRSRSRSPLRSSAIVFADLSDPCSDGV